MPGSHVWAKHTGVVMCNDEYSIKDDLFWLYHLDKNFDGVDGHKQVSGPESPVVNDCVRNDFKPPGCQLEQTPMDEVWFYQDIYGQDFLLPPATEVHISRDVLTLSFSGLHCRDIDDEVMEGILVEIATHLDREGLLHELIGQENDGRGWHVSFALKKKICIVGSEPDEY